MYMIEFRAAIFCIHSNVFFRTVLSRSGGLSAGDG